VGLRTEFAFVLEAALLNPKGPHSEEVVMPNVRVIRVPCTFRFAILAERIEQLTY
jgi:hypothetical protein